MILGEITQLCLPSYIKNPYGGMRVFKGEMCQLNTVFGKIKREFTSQLATSSANPT